MNKVPLTVNWLWPHSDLDSIEKHLLSSEVVPEDPVDTQASSPCLLSADPYCDPAPNRGYAGSKAVIRCSETLNSREWLWRGKTTKTRAKGRHWAQTPLYSKAQPSSHSWMTFHSGREEMYKYGNVYTIVLLKHSHHWTPTQKLFPKNYHCAGAFPLWSAVI